MSEYYKVETVVSNAGSAFVQDYSPKIERDGTLNLVPDGEHNLYDEIQSHKESCSISLALKRFALGDDSALNRVQGAYGDFTLFPKTFAEVLQVMINAEGYFGGLPADVRANFGNDFNRFLASLDDPASLYAKLGMEMPVASPAPDVSVKEEVVVES